MGTKEQIEGCINNDPIAQKYVFNKYSRQLMAVCVRYFYNIVDAEDALSESFVLIFKRTNQYRGVFEDKMFYSWMKKIAINVSLTKIRNSRFEKLQDSLEDHEFHIEDETIHDSFAAKDLLKIIHSLPAGFRTIFNLHAIEGYKHEEIGKMLGISESTSKSQYSRAKKHLRLKLEKMGITNSMIIA